MMDKNEFRKKYKRFTIGYQRAAILDPIVEYPARSNIRREMILKTLDHQRKFPGDGARILSRTRLYYWIRRYEKCGVEGVVPKDKTEAHKRGIIISRKWNKDCPLPLETKKRIENQLSAFVDSEWWVVNMLPCFAQRATAELIKLSKEAGWEDPKLEYYCTLIYGDVKRWKGYKPRTGKNKESFLRELLAKGIRIDDLYLPT